MLTLKEFMELVDFKITEGSDYHVNVPGLYLLSSWNGEQNGYSFGRRKSVGSVVIFTSKQRWRFKYYDGIFRKK